MMVMVDDTTGSDDQLAAGTFSSWLADLQRALRGEGESVVPCAGCTACCTSSQFIHIGPEEADTLDHIPEELLFPAPRMPRGHVLLGYDERGHCPMLIDNACSIYDHRPRTCRTYDCRVFPATGLRPEDGKVHIALRARRWKFSFPTPSDQVPYEAARAAASFLGAHPDLVPAAVAPSTTTQLAVLALEIHHVFLRHDEATGRTVVAAPAPEVVRDAVEEAAAKRG
jgi:Fe-S-cluster containining protein